jgi:hypothetical protein
MEDSVMGLGNTRVLADWELIFLTPSPKVKLQLVVLLK